MFKAAFVARATWFNKIRTSIQAGKLSDLSVKWLTTSYETTITCIEFMRLLSLSGRILISKVKTYFEWLSEEKNNHNYDQNLWYGNLPPLVTTLSCQPSTNLPCPCCWPWVFDCSSLIWGRHFSVDTSYSIRANLSHMSHILINEEAM